MYEREGEGYEVVCTRGRGRVMRWCVRKEGEGYEVVCTRGRGGL